jgi:hypothetical protein
LALVTYVVVAACAEQITAPEVETILRNVEHLTTDAPWDPTEREVPPDAYSRPIDYLWDRLGIPGAWQYTRFFEGAPPVVVSYSGVLKEYHGFVLERLTVPHDGGRGECGGPRWTLMLWHGRSQPDGILLAGGRFDRPLGPVQLCEDHTAGSPEPVVVAFPRPDDPDQYAWTSRSGSGHIGRGREISPCAFLAGGAVSYLADNGVTCTLTRHTVQLSSQLERNRHKSGSPLLRLAISRTEVPGIRWTIDCEHSRLNGGNLCQLD